MERNIKNRNQLVVFGTHPGSRGNNPDKIYSFWLSDKVKGYVKEGDLLSVKVHLKDSAGNYRIGFRVLRVLRVKRYVPGMLKPTSMVIGRYTGKKYE